MDNKILEWYNNKSINPYSKRRIKIGGYTYNKLMKIYNKYMENNSKLSQLCSTNDDNCKLSPLDSIEDKDIISLNTIWEMVDGEKTLVHEEPDNLICYKDESNHIHCFEKESIQYLKDYKINKHPITNIIIPQEILDSVDIKIEKIEKTVEQKALEIINLLTHLSFFIDIQVFLELDSQQLDSLYYESRSFFNSNIPTNHINILISQYDIFTIDLNDFKTSTNKLEYILKCFKVLLEYEDESIRILSNYIIIGSLSIVNKKVKELYPDMSFNF